MSVRLLQGSLAYSFKQIFGKLLKHKFPIGSPGLQCWIVE